MTRLGHVGAAVERVTGAIDLLRQHVRRGGARFALQIKTYRRDVRARLARVDVGEHIVHSGYGRLHRRGRRDRCRRRRPFRGPALYYGGEVRRRLLFRDSGGHVHGLIRRQCVGARQN